MLLDIVLGFRYLHLKWYGISRNDYEQFMYSTGTHNIKKRKAYDKIEN